MRALPQTILGKAVSLKTIASNIATSKSVNERPSPVHHWLPLLMHRTQDSVPTIFQRLRLASLFAWHSPPLDRE